MKTRLIQSLILLAVSAAACFAANAGERFSIDASSAKMYLDMARRAEAGTLPATAEWDSLFRSPAYKALLDNIHWDKEEFKGNVRAAFEIVYDPGQRSRCDSIVAMLDDMSSIQDELPFFVSTAFSIRENLKKYSDILSAVDMDSVADAANAMALELVPGRGRGLEPQGTSIYFIVWDLECRALDGGLFLDVNTFFHDGLQAATEALAHEMHHFYLGPVFESVYADDVMDGAAAALVFNMREGVADIINKKRMPLTSLVPYGEGMLRMYNADYESTPEVLKELDDVTCRYLDGQTGEEEYFRQALGCAHFEGHTTGDYMVFLIRDRLGLDAVVESVGDLDAFIDNYNKAAQQAGTYVFSPRFTAHIHSVSRASKRPRQ